MTQSEMTGFQPIIPGHRHEDPLYIAGPCSAETREQVLETAAGIHAAGIPIFRAGIWKPRTRPGGFEGVGAEGLPWMQEVKERTGMYTATEVATRAHVEAALAHDIDILWIGARTSANPFAMQEIADAIKDSGKDVAVLVKNPVNPDLELWIGALLRIYNAGVRRLGAIHRGFSAYGKHLYRNMPIWRIALELARRVPGLTILCDPSHIGGKRELIAPLAQQAMDMGFDGLIIESHCEPDCALSDKSQQITPEVLDYILKTLTLHESNQSTESLGLLRQEIDRLDNELFEILNRRMAVSRDIARYKKEHRMPIVQAGRYDEIVRSRCDMAQQMGMNTDFARGMMATIHEESVRQQLDIYNRR